MDYFDLGDYSFPVTTNSKDAQLWFDRGLMWIYGYNHEEAIFCFDKAIEIDENCAMAYWGVSYAVSEDMSISYGYSEIDYETSTTLSQEATGISASYTMGSMTLAGTVNDITNQGSGATGNTDTNAETFEINLAFAF